MQHRILYIIVGMVVLLLSISGVTSAQSVQLSSEIVQQISSYGQDSDTSTSRIGRSERIVDTSIVIPKLDFNAVAIREALTALARAYSLSLLIDTSVSGTLTMQLENVSLNDALRFIIYDHGLVAERFGDAIKVSRPARPPEAEPQATITTADSLVSIEAKRVDLHLFLDQFTDQTKINVLPRAGISGSVSGKIVELAPVAALDAFLASNGFSLSSRGNVLYVGAAKEEPGIQHERLASNVKFEEGVYSVDLSGANLASTIRQLANLANRSIVFESDVQGQVNAQFTTESFSEALKRILRGSKYTSKRVSDLYIVGDKNAISLHDSRLVQLDNVSANTVDKLIPSSLTAGVSHLVYIEQNAILFNGASSQLDDIEEFLRRVDLPTAQVLFDVLVVDYNNRDFDKWQLLVSDTGSSSPSQYFPDIAFGFSGNLDDVENALGVKNLGTLSDGFFAQLEILAQEGRAKIIQRPQIAALNGHSASIQIGTTQYYLLETSTDYPVDGSDVTTRTQQRFETIEANVSLKVTPLVTKSGEVIVDIQPEFNTPTSGFNPDIPPTINSRVLQSTVRLKDGETIVLGGLVNSSSDVNIRKVPILGDIPILGYLFQNRTSTKTEDELMIYITPHVYYGSDGAINIQNILDEL